MANQEVAVFTERARRVWYEGDWYFSVVDVIAALTDSKDRQVAALTDTLSVGGLGITTRDHKALKGLKARDNLRDSQTIMELAITGLAEATAVTLHQERDTQGFPALRSDCHEAGKIAGDARRQVEQATGKLVVNSTNYKQLQQEKQRDLQPPLFDQQED